EISVPDQSGDSRHGSILARAARSARRARVRATGTAMASAATATAAHQSTREGRDMPSAYRGQDGCGNIFTAETPGLLIHHLVIKLKRDARRLHFIADH